MPGQTAGSRLYSAPPGHGISMGYAWSDTYLLTGTTPTTTGCWVPISLDASGFLLVNTQASTNTYQSVITGFTGSQVSIPVGAYDWTVTVQSGTAFINGFPVFAGSQVPIAGGLIGNGSKLNTSLNVGCTGGRVLVTWDV